MNWTNQSEELLKNWTEMQKQMWEQTMKAMQPGTTSTVPTELWRQMISAWEATMKNSLAGQTEWGRLWIKNLESLPGVPPEMVKWARQTQDLNDQWMKNQENLWQSWFELLEKAEGGTLDEKMQAEGEKAFDSWQESAEKIIEAQTEWFKMFNHKQPV